MTWHPPRTLTERDVARQAEMLENRVRKNRRHLGRLFAREGVSAYRLYDWDIPELRLVVDLYGDSIVVAEYERALTQTVDNWLESMAEACARGAGVDPQRVITKRRRTRTKDSPRYGRLDQLGERQVVSEGDLRFWVNLTDYIDTGLFTHHRITRRKVRSECAGASVLNLYGYTGAFTCAAAAGGATRTVTVDASQTYIDWARDNLELNGVDGEGALRHQLVVDECRHYLARAAANREQFQLCVLDPPSFSDRGSGGEFDVARDHHDLIEETLAVIAPGGTLWFSTNHARFEPDFEGLPVRAIRELTRQTTPPDFRRPPHRLWRMER